MPDPTPNRIDRAALERIMQRAAELQAAETDVGEGLTSEEVLALGREVGIPGRYLQQAMLEHSTSVTPPAEAGVAGHLIGPREVSAQRVVQGDPEDVARALVAWFDSNELLVVLRQQAGRVTFEPLGGMQAAIRRGTAAFSSSKPKYMLSRAKQVSATFTKLETGYCHVSLSADLSSVRGGYVGGAFALGSAGVAGAAILALLSPFWVIAIPPLVVGGAAGWFALKQYRPVAERAALGLERALDYLERGGVKPGHEIPPRSGGLLETLAGELKKAIGSSSEKRQR